MLYRFTRRSNTSSHGLVSSSLDGSWEGISSAPRWHPRVDGRVDGNSQDVVWLMDVQGRRYGLMSQGDHELRQDSPKGLFALASDHADTFGQSDGSQQQHIIMA